MCRTFQFQLFDGMVRVKGNLRYRDSRFIFVFFMAISPACLKDEELWFPHEIWAHFVVELLEDPLVVAPLAVRPEDEPVAPMAQNHNHTHLGLK